jgi:uncharacterized membrane protein (DUF485 family)
MKTSTPWIVTIITCLAVFTFIALSAMNPQKYFQQSYNGDYTWPLILMCLGFLASYVIAQGAYKSLKNKDKK